MNYGVASMTAPLRRVALRKPGASIQQANAETWNYGPGFDKDKVESEHAAFTDLLVKKSVEILWMDEESGIADAVFTYDASLMTPDGAILMKPGKPLRAGEQELHRNFYAQQGIPIVGEITGDGHAEAGDTLWLDEKTLAVGRGFRTNQSGIDQLKAQLAGVGIDVHAFDLPVYYGASACLHLMSLVSLVDSRVAAICKLLLPVGLYQLMQGMGFSLIDIPYAEYESSGTLSGNILAIAPGECIMIDGFVLTRKLLQEAGIKVQVFTGDSLCIGCEGGPTCMSRPIYRSW
jgi:N-dimethylarginine dimethylaminohydrolase